VRREVIVTAGAPMTMTIKLEMIPHSGKVRITTRQPDATVTVDGKPVGLGPLDLELGLGGHQIEVTANGYQTHRGEIVVAAGQERVVDIGLEKVKKKKVYEKWYFWTPLLVVVLGGAATAIALTLTSKNNDTLQGTLAPGAGNVTQ
jgi:hypothetical protein